MTKEKKRLYYFYICDGCGEAIRQRLDTIKNMKWVLCRTCSNKKKGRDNRDKISKGMKRWWDEVDYEDRKQLTNHLRTKGVIKKRAKIVKNGYDEGKYIIWNKGMKGKDSHMWIDDRSKVKEPLNYQIRGCMDMKNWRIDIFIRDKHTCQVCHQKGGDLNAHHITPFADIINNHNITTYKQALKCKPLWNIDNGITLCESCHKWVHTLDPLSFQ